MFGLEILRFSIIPVQYKTKYYDRLYINHLYHDEWEKERDKKNDLGAIITMFYHALAVWYVSVWIGASAQEN